MSDVNVIHLLGNVGRDPDVRETRYGRMATFSLATKRVWSDKASGERKENTAWHRVVCYNEHLVGIIERFVQRGTRLYVQGRVQDKSWTDKAGNVRYSADVEITRFEGGLSLQGAGDTPDMASQTPEVSWESDGFSTDPAPKAGEEDDLPW